MIERVGRSIDSLLRHDGLIVVNELRSAFAAWTDRLIALVVVLIALGAMRAALLDRPATFAATAVAVLAAISGAWATRFIQCRLDFHCYDGVIAADALATKRRRRYSVSLHAIACGIVILCALIGRPATAVLAPLGYLAGAGSCHIAWHGIRGGRIVRRPAFPPSVGMLLRGPGAGALAAVLVILPLLFAGAIEPGAMATLVGLISAVVALLLTMPDAGIVRFMTLSGYRAVRIVAIHARPLLAFCVPSMLACAALSHGPAAVVVGSVVVVVALLVMTARILAYRVRSKRTADTIVSICVVVATVAGVVLPMLIPFVAIAILWNLQRRSVSATWLLT